jgi:hypothetical protein
MFTQDTQHLNRNLTPGERRLLIFVGAMAVVVLAVLAYPMLWGRMYWSRTWEITIFRYAIFIRSA